MWFHRRNLLIYTVLLYRKNEVCGENFKVHVHDAEQVGVIDGTTENSEQTEMNVHFKAQCSLYRPKT